MNRTPLVSIVIPVYKGENYLAEAIDSALAQTYKNIEIIVVNDGSPDDGATERVARSYGDRIRYICQKNGGVSAALNTGIREMKGEYFSWLSHDDLYCPEKIEKQVALIETDNDIILCSGTLMNGEGKSIPYYTKVVEGHLIGVELFRHFLHGYALNGLGFLIPKRVFEREGTFDESLRYMQDLDLWLRFLWKDYTFVCHKDLLVKTRIHSGQQTNQIADQYLPDCKAMMQKHIQGLKSCECPDKVGILKCYLLLASGEVYGDSANEIRKMLKENGCRDTMRLEILLYKTKKTIKQQLRRVRDFFYKLNGQRTN